VYALAGVHPHEAKDVPEGYLDEVGRCAAHERNVAVGEIGLDYHYDFSPRPAQREVFAAQLDLAGRLGKPVVIHSREAIDDTLAVLADAGVPGERLVFHSFTAGPDDVRRVLDLGAVVSFAGVVTFARADDNRRAARLVPADRLLIETDAPYLSPEPVRKIKTNEPANVLHTLRKLAEVRAEPPEALAEQTTANARRFFGI
jgi:TatD DNase family protein